ncbi:hypothetical protein [Estrella lausannensis]|uniref:Rubrerythrin diiron-binding domain-containing protein n=1 Tax=Estrella lausannensis TaxID=483423 RepID=A0A0H5DQF1_9BACT|nr:hypothetical protein [Estrella lausannensis]CRX38876.1 Conserved hypothetical protein [Estrella lausannensis]
MCFVSLKERLRNVILKALSEPKKHALFLNTLSYLENQGARKIAAAEDPYFVKREMLKHAAEEFRHAFYLKEQINKVHSSTPLDYSKDNILGWPHTAHYLNALDVRTQRYLRKHFQGSFPLERKASYTLVTAAIELRASELYPLYQSLLKQARSPVRVQSIVLEEAQHLEEMKSNIGKIPDGDRHLRAITSIESTLCRSWIEAVNRSL